MQHIISNSCAYAHVSNCEIKSTIKPTFWQASKWALLSFVGLDVATTCLAIESGAGFEGNPFMAAVIGAAGLIGLAAVKLAYVGFIYCVYRTTSTRNYSFAASFVAVLGFALALNNLCVMGGIL